MDLFVFTFHKDKQLYRALSPLSPQQVEDKGLPTEAVLGQIDAVLPSMTPDQFEQNEAFVALLHTTVTNVAPQINELQAQAKTLGTGELHIIDGRAGKVTGEMSQEDIIGTFAVRRGELDSSSYQPNEAYRILTDNGPIQLAPDLEHALLTTIMEIAQHTTSE